MSENYQPRYLAYCKAHGRKPEEQMEHDREQWPGGIMCGFILWMSQKFAEWRAVAPPCPVYARMTGEDAKGFDKFIGAASD